MKTLYLIICLLIACQINNNVYIQSQKVILENQMKLVNNPVHYQNINVFYKFKRKINFIKETNTNITNDTLYIVDVCDIDDETGKLHYYCVLWNNKKRLNYKICGRSHNNYKKTKNNLISKYQIDLISRWDIKQLEEESKINKINGGGFFFINRIILKNNGHRTETFLFNSFYNFSKEY